MAYNRETTLCFSGHRICTANPGDGERLEAALADAYRDGYRTFISGMAEGFDLAAAEAVLALRQRHPDVSLVAAIPFRGQAARFAAADRLRYEKLLAAADEVAVLSERYAHGCYYARDDWMIENSSRLVCFYDGRPGGTRYTVRRALRGKLDIVNIYMKPGTLF